MRRHVNFVAFLVVSAAALAVAGDEPKTYDVDWKGKWNVGQIVTFTSHETGDMDMTMDGAPFQSQHEALDFEYVMRCDAVDDARAPTKRTLFVRSWKSTKGPTTDDSISGARIDVDGKVWTVAGGKPAGPLAKKWLDRRYAGKGGDPYEALQPPKLAVGQTWKADPKAAADAFAKSLEDAPFDASAVEAQITLVSVEGAPPDAVGSFEMKFHAPLAGPVKSLPPNAKLLPTSVVDAKGTRKAPLGESAMLDAERTDMEMTMDVEIDARGKTVMFATKAKMTRDEKAVAGGAIPDAAATEPK